MNGNEGRSFTGESTRDGLTITLGRSICTFHTGSHRCDVKMREMDKSPRPD